MKNSVNTDSHLHHPSAPPLDIGRQLVASWPFGLGLLALLLNLSGGADSHVTAMIMMIAATCYLAAAVLGSRRSVWVMVIVVSVVVILARLAGLDVTVTLLVMGAGFAILGFLRSPGVSRKEVGVQVLGFLIFSALALITMVSAPVIALYLAAAAAIGHAIWDVIHYLRDRVVSRSLAQACFVLDLGLGIALLVSGWALS